jgi:hypothetical protein
MKTLHAVMTVLLFALLTVLLMRVAIADSGDPVPTWIADAAPSEGATAEVTVPDPGEDTGGFAEATYSAIKAGQWLVAAGLVLIGLVYLARRFGGKVWPFLATDRGGVVATLVLSLVGAVAHSLAVGEPMSLAMLMAALGVAWTASGGWSQLRRLFAPPDKE